MGDKKLPGDTVDRRGGGNAVLLPNGSRIGQAAHVKTDAVSNKVRMMAGVGMPQKVIALACDVSVDTLNRHYRRELDLGGTDANTQVGAAIFQNALGERVECVECDKGRTEANKKCRTCFGTGMVWRREPSATSQIWWSKNRMGWADQQKVEVNNISGPVVEQVSAADAIKARLSAIRERREAAALEATTKTIG